MSKSNKPLVWGPFAAGGTITAFVTPVLIVLTLLVALGQVPDALTHDRMLGLAQHWLGKVVIFGVVSLSLWTSAHRLRITFYDVGVRCDTLVAALVYLAAALGSLGCLVLLVRL